MKGRVGSPPGPRPWLWRTGPDPVAHDRYVAYNRSRAQAQWRGEQWLLTREQFDRVWGEAWSRRGRASDDLCMTRCDPNLPWSEHNVELISRGEHTRRAARARRTT